MVKKLVMAQKRGETRALCLGVAMVVCAVITYYILCTTMLPLYQRSVWTQESTCHLIETDIRHQEELEGRKVSPYPCLWVNVSAVGKWAVLYHTEDTRSQNQQCSYIPDSLDNYQMARADVEKLQSAVDGVHWGGTSTRGRIHTEQEATGNKTKATISRAWWWVHLLPVPLFV
ncbi:calcium-activated potassium channel subunit beta-1 isoform X2 [Marmota monax]|uniref:calcium-activated potassium channel subunit beta-1 isoform X2 n=1 Tax=Marmota monax TaxID=9995 RepID=UPI001EB0A698|nr:calcium-activated potassium channel subunit beta-1 isoform X2 [Marmota monax]